MIIDTLDKIQNYNVNERVIKFLKSLNTNSQTGHFEIDENSYANIDEYQTKLSGKFEAHKKFIDIQMLLNGCEEIDISNLNGLKISEAYDENKDVMFFYDGKTQDKIFLEPFKFIIINPYEAHKPQIAIDNLPQNVKKVVVKIKI